MTDAPRWLDRDATAAYISVRADELRRLLRAGKLPSPSYHLGPRSPRWDRLKLDSYFGEGVASDETRAQVTSLVQEIYAERRSRRSPDPRGRHR